MAIKRVVNTPIFDTSFMCLLYLELRFGRGIRLACAISYIIQMVSNIIYCKANNEYPNENS